LNRRLGAKSKSLFLFSVVSARSDLARNKSAHGGVTPDISLS
jgi:hypothetical protein